MMKHKRIGVIAALMLAAAVLFLCAVRLLPETFAPLMGASVPPYAAAMDKTKVLDIQIIADESDWAEMLANATAEAYIPATVVIDGKKIGNVGIRPKGNSSLSTVARDDTTDRYSFKLEFDQYVSGQTWLGLDKFVVNNMQGDATYMKEYLAYDIMADAGVETPLYAFANISVNGEPWGFYLAVEALEDSYAKRVYGNDHGQLYKPEGMGARGNGQMNDILEGLQNGEVPARGGETPVLEGEVPAWGGELPVFDGELPAWGDEVPAWGEEMPNRGGMAGGNFGGLGGGGFGGQGGTTLQYVDDEIDSYSVIFEGAAFDINDSDRHRVISALKQLDEGEGLETVVDVEATLRYFAAHTVIVNLDSYVSSMCHNYYLYEENGQLTMLPWDFNLAFGGFQSGSASSVVNFPIDTPVSGVSLEDRPMLGQLLAVPEYMELYHTYLQELVDGYLEAGRMAQTIADLDALIAGYVAADASAFYDYKAYRSAVAELEKLITLRTQSIAGQLAGTIPATTAGQAANPDALVDASTINLSVLGSMGGGMGGNMGNIGAEIGGNMGGGMGGNRGNMEGSMGGDRGLGGAGMPNRQSREGGQSMRGNETSAGTAVAAASGAGVSSQNWIVLGGCVLLMLGGLCFAVLFRRRG